MFVLGLTGSLGMGKSTTARFFAEEGIPVHDADAVVHRLYAGEAASAIEAAFPGTTSNGKVDRNKLAARVLNDPAALNKLEAIMHPLVQAAEQQLLAQEQRHAARRLRSSISRSCSRPGLIAGWMPSWWCRRLPRPNARAYWHARE